ncbi:hypothetical protein [Corynebacterium pacaense]|uniref:hypothetical protein n=1 Tax=Corynebacterium pacaense TaxID=1816684 RepID=UPI0009BA5D61|nr:hypothetical protein [Corynebacterium pacaense]
MDPSILHTSSLSIHGRSFVDVDVEQGLTLLTTAREASSSSYSLVLSGRMRPDAGTVLLDGTPAKARQLARHIALAGVTEIDSLERLVTVRAVVREQIAWASPWYRLVPRAIDQDSSWRHYSEMLGLDLNPGTLVGDLDVGQRFLLRVALSLISRRDPKLLVVDDPDQVRSMQLRSEILSRLKEVSTAVPVLVVSTNPDFDGIADATEEVAA